MSITNQAEQSRATAYRNRRGQEIKLPSGESWMLKRISIQDLLARGAIPDTLAPLIEEMIGKVESTQGIDSDVSISAEIEQRLNAGTSKLDQLKMMNQLLDRFLVACCLDPRVTEDFNEAELQSNTLHVSDVDTADKEFIFRWSQGDAESVDAGKSSGEESTGDVDAISEVGTVEPTSIRPARNRTGR